MPAPLADDLHWHSSLEREAGVGVAEVMQPDLAEPGPADDPLERLAERTSLPRVGHVRSGGQLRIDWISRGSVGVASPGEGLVDSMTDRSGAGSIHFPVGRGLG